MLPSDRLSFLPLALLLEDNRKVVHAAKCVLMLQAQHPSLYLQDFSMHLLSLLPLALLSEDNRQVVLAGQHSFLPLAFKMDDSCKDAHAGKEDGCLDVQGRFQDMFPQAVLDGLNDVPRNGNAHLCTKAKEIEVKKWTLGFIG